MAFGPVTAKDLKMKKILLTQRREGRKEKPIEARQLIGKQSSRCLDPLTIIARQLVDQHQYHAKGAHSR
jgi:hypothetical protein